VKHQVNWLNRFCSLTSGKGKKKKKLKGRYLMVFSIFAPYQSKSLQKCSLLIESICLTGYIGGQKSSSSGVPIHASAEVLLLAM
jgi:hypothetical protein